MNNFFYLNFKEDLICFRRVYQLEFPQFGTRLEVRGTPWESNSYAFVCKPSFLECFPAWNKNIDYYWIRQNPSRSSCSISEYIDTEPCFTFSRECCVCSYTISLWISVTLLSKQRNIFSDNSFYIKGYWYNVFLSIEIA